VPPSPANYAQRSGRAGRSGQPALVVTYCSGGSPHDQYFFRRPHRMVSGQVTPPRLDLANEDLVRAHVHSVWLAETGMSLGRSLKDLLDVGGEPPSLQLQAHVKADVDKQGARDKAKARAVSVLSTVESELNDSNWWGPTWLDDAFRTLGTHFEHACERWRSLYRAARAQADAQNKIILDASRSAKDKNEAKEAPARAEAQLDLLTATGAAIIQSDFYSYRYFASEGFLPGYSFPRLPLSAFIRPEGRPAQRRVPVAAPLPGYQRVWPAELHLPRRLPLRDQPGHPPVADAPDPVTGRTLITSSAKICALCGYLHPLPAPVIPDKCQHCSSLLGPEMKQALPAPERHHETARPHQL